MKGVLVFSPWTLYTMEKMEALISFLSFYRGMETQKGALAPAFGSIQDGGDLRLCIDGRQRYGKP